MIAYIDTSALLKRVLDEPGADVAYEVWNAADLLVSSEIVYAEARGAAAAARRARRIDAGELREAVRAIDSLCDSLEILEVDRPIALAAGELAEKHRLHGHDAVHLATAVGISARRVVVATWDKALARAATTNGVGVIPAQQQPIQPGELVLR